MTEPATEPTTEPATEPATEPTTEPTTEPATEPVTRQNIWPVFTKLFKHFWLPLSKTFIVQVSLD